MNFLRAHVRSIGMASVLALSGLGMLTYGSVNPAPALEQQERHPHIRHALKALREARKELKEAAHDFNGHRKEALEAVDGAIKQLDLAMKNDRK